MSDSYGDVTGEYASLRTGAAVVTGTHEVVWVRGPDAAGFLDGLLSQDLAAAVPGSVVRSLLLAPQGKLRAVLWVLVGDAEFGLVADAGVGDDVVGDLSRFKIRVDAQITGPAELSSLVGPEAATVLGRIELVTDGWSAHPLVAKAPLGSLPRYFIAEESEPTVLGNGAARAGRLALTAVRVEQGEPRMGVDIDGSTIPQEADVVEGAVSFTKGCYLGQELVARIDSRGHVNRHLRAVVLEDNVLPPEGAEVVSGERVVGRITSVAESLEVMAPVGLGLIRREVQPADRVEVTWEGGTASARVEALPLV